MIAKVFPTINNFQPYFSKYSTPYYGIYYFNTPYSVKHNGVETDYYVANTVASLFGSSKWHTYTPLIKFHYGKVFPPSISSYFNDYNYFGISYFGIFDPNGQTAASLYLSGYGQVRVIGLFNGYDSGTLDLGISRSNLHKLNITGLTGALNKLIQIKYISPNKFSNFSNTLSITWKNSTIDKPIPLAAGNFFKASEYSSPILGTKIKYLGDVSSEFSKNNISKLTFTIPIASSSDSQGYQYIKSGDYFQDVSDSNNKIRKFRMVELHTGYSYSGSLSTITKFVGQIRNWQIRRSGGKSEAVIECYDWASFLSDAINEGYPNVSDYLAFDYLDPENISGVAGDSKPRTYDGWEFQDAVDSLLINAYIDPSLLWKYRRHENVDGNVVNGRYLVDERNMQYPIKLDKSFNYGNPLAINNSDDPYIWQFSIGDSLLDNVQKLIDNYGFRHGFNNQGYFYCKSVKNPIYCKSIDEISFTGTWSEEIDTNSLFAVSKKTNELGAVATATYVGTSCQLVFDRNVSFGDVHIRVSNPTLGITASFDYDLNYTEKWNYFKGNHDLVGYNPCLINVGSDFKYGSYSINIETLSTATVSINAILINEINYLKSFGTLYTGDTTSKIGVVLDNMGVNSNANDLRNDIVVVGRLEGVVSSLAVSDEDVDSTVNANNPTSQHIVARAIDRNSTGSISNNSYVGRPLQSLIIEPSISTNNRARWLASETIKRYNEFTKLVTPDISIYGNPLLEVDDYLKLQDIKLNTLATIHDFWISGVVDNYSPSGEYTTRLSIESFEPWESFYNYPTPSLSRFNYQVFRNIKLVNTGLPLTQKEHCTLSQEQNFYPYDTTSTIAVKYYADKSTFNTINGTISKESLYRLIPNKGYIKVHNEIIKYQNVVLGTIRPNYSGGQMISVVASIYYKDLLRGRYNTATISNLANYVGEYVECQISPYTTEEDGIAPGITFDLLFPGKVKLSVIGPTGAIVDVLTGNVSDFSGDSGWETLNPGTYSYVWGMIDRAGKHNEDNGGFFQKSGSLTLDMPYLYEEEEANRAALGNWVDKYGNWLWPERQYKIGSGFYVQNTKNRKYGSFQFVLDYVDPTKDFIKTGIRLYSIKNINSVIRPTGFGPGLDRGSDGIFEESFFSRYSGIDYTELPYQFWSHEENKYLRFGTPFANSNYPDYSDEDSDYRDLTHFGHYYTGLENEGKGLKFGIRTNTENPRIARISVTRYILPIIWFYLRNKEGTMRGLYAVDKSNIKMDTPISSDGFYWNFSSTATTYFYIAAPNIPFVVAPNSIEFVTLSNKISDVLKFGAIQVHMFKIVLQDYSGRKSYKAKSIFYVDPAFLSTPDNIKRNYDGITINSALSSHTTTGGTWEIPRYWIIDSAESGIVFDPIMTLQDDKPAMIYSPIPIILLKDYTNG